MLQVEARELLADGLLTNADATELAATYMYMTVRIYSISDKVSIK